MLNYEPLFNQLTFGAVGLIKGVLETETLRLGYDPTRIDPRSILDRITKD
jgi:hypothetical protein